MGRKLATKQDNGMLFYQFSLEDQGSHKALETMPLPVSQRENTKTIELIKYWDSVGGLDFEA